VDPLELRQIPRNRSCLGAKNNTVKRVAEMFTHTQKYVTPFAMQVAGATKSSAVKRVAEMFTHTQEYITPFPMQTAGATNTLASF
jgi:hypothetical protein